MVDTTNEPPVTSSPFGGKLPDIHGDIEIYPADPPHTRRVRSEYIGLADKKGVAVRWDNGHIIEDVRGVEMALTITNMLGPGMNTGLLSRGDKFWASEKEARHFEDNGQAVRTGVVLNPEPVVVPVTSEPVVNIPVSALVDANVPPPLAPALAPEIKIKAKPPVKSAVNRPTVQPRPKSTQRPRTSK